jgi:hypothetical protein
VNKTVAAAGERIHEFVLVDSPFRCPWRIEWEGADWVTLISPQVGPIYNGDSDLHLSIAPNTTGRTRSTTLYIAEKLYVITQPSQ